MRWFAFMALIVSVFGVVLLCDSSIRHPSEWSGVEIVLYPSLIVWFIAWSSVNILLSRKKHPRSTRVLMGVFAVTSTSVFVCLILRGFDHGIFDLLIRIVLLLVYGSAALTGFYDFFRGPRRLPAE